MNEIFDHPANRHHEAEPTPEECVLAVAKCVAARRAKRRGEATPKGAALFDAIDIAWSETITGDVARLSPVDEPRDMWGFTVPPRAGVDDWWLVGRFVDELEEATFSVWYMPGPRRIGFSRRERRGARPITNGHPPRTRWSSPPTTPDYS